MRKFATWAWYLPVVVAVAAPASATSYLVNQTIGAAGHVTGTIDTDGTTGALGASNISAWDLLVSGPGASITLSNLNSGVYSTGSGLIATSSGITFDYSNPVDSFLIFQAGGFGSQATYWCNASAAGSCFQGATASPQYYFDSSRQTEARSGVQDIASGAAAAVPEPATWALMILGFGGIGASIRHRRAALAA